MCPPEVRIFNTIKFPPENDHVSSPQSQKNKLCSIHKRKRERGSGSNQTPKAEEKVISISQDTKKKERRREGGLSPTHIE